MKITIHDDKKEGWQSFTAKIKDWPLEMYAYGENQEEAIESLREKLSDFLSSLVTEIVTDNITIHDDSFKKILDDAKKLVGKGQSIFGDAELVGNKHGVSIFKNGQLIGVVSHEALQRLMDKEKEND